MLLQTSPFTYQSSSKDGVEYITDVTGCYKIDGETDVYVESNSSDNDSRHISYLVKLPQATYKLKTLCMHLNAGIGSSFWISSIAMCALIHQNPSLVEGKSVLELGSGVGLGGIAAYANNAKRVVLTDNNQDVMENLQQNLLLNKSTRIGKPSTFNSQNVIEQHLLDWDYCLNSEYLTSENYVKGPFSTIIVSDCVYRHTKDGLKSAILKNLSKKEDSHVIIINPIRDGLDEFYYGLQEYGTLRLNSSNVNFKNHNIKLSTAIFTPDTTL